MIKRKRFRLRISTLLVAFSALPGALCASNYYVDPIQGSPSNDGSQCAPWKTLQQVFEMGTTFQPGDHIYLLRGDHGAPIIKGFNTAMVTIEPFARHTPVVQSLRITSASNWDIKGLFVSPKAAPNMVRVSVPQLVNISEDSHHITFEDAYVFSDFLVDSWTQASWRSNGRWGILVRGPYNIVRNNHFYNTVTAIQLDFHAHHNLIDHNIVENFGHDGIQEKGSFNTFQYNLVLNVFNMGDGNHPDGFQAFGSGNMHDTTLNGNIVISSFKHPNPALYDGTMQGIGLFSTYVNYTVINNIVLNDHRIGIWLLGGKNCKVINNTIFHNGDHARTGGGPPGIRMHWVNKGVPSRNGVGNIVENNIAEELGLTNLDGSSVCTTTANCSNNLLNTSASIFLKPSVRDVHPTNSAQVINGGDPTFAPLLDADQVARGGRIDRGAYQFISGLTADTTPPTVPQGLMAVFVPGLGVDLSWTASTDNRQVVGYEIYRNGIRIGRIRAGTHFLDPILNAAGMAYTVKAFDFSMNFSAASSQVTPIA